jgi:hypothetical protein
MALYNADGQMNLTVVSGSSYTGAQAPDGSYYIVLNDGSTYTGARHACGAMNAVVSTSAGATTHPNGSMYVVVQEDGVGYTPASSSNPTVIDEFTNGITMANTSTFRDTYRAGLRNTRVAFIGDSTTRGQSTGGGTSQAVNSWPMQLSTLLNAAGINAGANNVWGDGGSWGLGQTIANFKTGDSRVTSTGAWALGSVLSAGGNNFGSASAGTMTFTPQTNCDTCQVIWRDGAAGRDWDFAVDGGAATNVLSTGATQFKIETFALGSLAPHTVTLSWDLGTIHILGINCYNSTRKELSLWNWGICGGTSLNLINNTDAVVGRLAILAHASLKPDLAFIEGGIINDWRTSVAIATSKSQITTLVTTAKANGTNVILCVPPVDTGVAGATANQAAYVAAMYEIAAEQSVGIINFREISIANSDTVHPTAAGYLSMATLARKVLQQIL